MKRACLFPIAIFLLSLPSFGQQRPRFFDNFDTSRGVQVYRPPSPVSSAKSRNKKLVEKTVQSRSVSTPTKTARTRTSVYDGLADREPSRPAESLRMTMGTAAGMKGFTTGNIVYDSYIVDSSRRYGIDPLLIYSQMHTESSFKLRATSNKGASGLMQLMPATARRLGVTNIYEPKQNIEGGVKYMRMLLDMFGGDVRLALAGYNAGEGAVMKYGNQIPPFRETQEYVRRITARYDAISNPSYARTAMRVTGGKATRLAQRDARPLAVYEPNPLAIRLPDGRMRLVNQ
jgi:soluble lytic murein transglycosylase-like protein